jgi:hypothetical protein
MIGVRSGDLKFFHLSRAKSSGISNPPELGPGGRAAMRGLSAAESEGAAVARLAETPDASPGFFPTIKSSGRRLVGHCPSRVAKVSEIIFDPARPIGCECVFNAGTT